MNPSKKTPIDVELWQLANTLIFMWSDYTHKPEEFKKSASISNPMFKLMSLEAFCQFMRNHSHDTYFDTLHTRVRQLLLSDRIAISCFYFFVIQSTLEESQLTQEMQTRVRQQAQDYLWNKYYGSLSEQQKQEVYQNLLSEVTKLSYKVKVPN